jgi:hypothetical protein
MWFSSSVIEYMSAKKIFLSNGGGSNLAYDAFYSKMKEWGPARGRAQLIT